jgi:hypothetical protein
MGVFCANNWPYGDRASKLLFVSSDVMDPGHGYGFQAILHNSMMGQFMVCVSMTVLYAGLRTLREFSDFRDFCFQFRENEAGFSSECLCFQRFFSSY